MAAHSNLTVVHYGLKKKQAKQELDIALDPDFMFSF